MLPHLLVIKINSIKDKFVYYETVAFLPNSNFNIFHLRTHHRVEVSMLHRLHGSQSFLVVVPDKSTNMPNVGTTRNNVPAENNTITSAACQGSQVSQGTPDVGSHYEQTCEREKTNKFAS